MSEHRVIPGTELAVFPLCLGGNPFGWTAGEPAARAVLDTYVGAGGNFLDTADMYGSWVTDDDEVWSESIIGRWMASGVPRDSLVLATKVGMMPGNAGLSRAQVLNAIHNSLRRLQTNHVDLYYAHQDDATTPIPETLGTFDELVQAGKIRYVGLSNYSPARARAVLGAAREAGYRWLVAMQPRYNLVDRDYETSLAPVCVEHGVGCFPYYGLAKGFLTGKYRSPDAASDSPNAPRAKTYATPEGLAVLDVLEQVSGECGASMAAVALAWLAAQSTVVAPLAGARSGAQVEELLESARVVLTAEQMQRLGDAEP
jgi:aryl-alcohol dehydrogenase (NADP+)